MAAVLIRIIFSMAPAMAGATLEKPPLMRSKAHAINMDRAYTMNAGESASTLMRRKPASAYVADGSSSSPAQEEAHHYAVVRPNGEVKEEGGQARRATSRDEQKSPEEQLHATDWNAAQIHQRARVHVPAHKLVADRILENLTLRTAAVVLLVVGILFRFRALSSFAGRATKDASKPTFTRNDQLLSPPQLTRQQQESGRVRADIKLAGMTCSACACAIERCLRTHRGVESAAVNVVLERATVVFNSTTVTAAALCEAVEDIGFDASVLCADRADGKDTGNKAELHLQVSAEKLESIKHRLTETSGVLACEGILTDLVRVSYNPCKIGARTLLVHAQRGLPECSVKCAPPQENDQTMQLRRHQSELMFKSKGSALPAFLVFVVTIILPGRGIDLGTFDFHNYRIQIATVIVLALALPVQFYFGAIFHVNAKKALERATPNMDVLVSTSTNISFAYALAVLILQVCTTITAHRRHTETLGYAENGPVEIGLGCHALHFFGMAPILIAVVLGGKAIETGAKIRSMDRLVELMECRNNDAQLVSADGSEQLIPAELVQIGDKLRLFEGGRVPADGVLVTDDFVWANESILTGESTATQKASGSKVIGGTTVVSGAGLMEATAIGSKTTLGEIVTMISKAQATKTATQQSANVFASFFVTSVMILSACVFSIWLFLGLTHRVAFPADVQADNTIDIVLFAAKFGVAVLMVACPCAMGLATPTAVMVSSGVAAKFGCLVKSAEAIEEASRADVIVFDKTGTITNGKLSVSGLGVIKCALDPALHVQLLDLAGGVSPAKPAQTVCPEILDGSHSDKQHRSAQEVEHLFWWCVGTAEAGSDHPAAKCLVKHALDTLGCTSFPAPEKFRSTVGRGVSAFLEVCKMDVRVGSVKYLEDSAKDLKHDLSKDVHFCAVQRWISQKTASMESVVLVHAVVQRRLCILGAIAMRDVVRPDAAAAIRHLRDKRGMSIWMCTGDAESTARAVAREVGIPQDQVCAEALPKQKAERVEELRRIHGGRVCMVGDGVNDAPALAAADVGIAVGAGACLAMEAADVVLISSDLPTLAAYLDLSKLTMRTIWRNFGWAFIFNICGLPLAAGVFYPTVVMPPLIAGLAMSASSVLVVSQSLLINLFKPPLPPSACGDAALPS
jgi:Cu+-exporting ATPase